MERNAMQTLLIRAYSRAQTHPRALSTHENFSGTSGMPPRAYREERDSAGTIRLHQLKCGTRSRCRTIRCRRSGGELAPAPREHGIGRGILHDDSVRSDHGMGTSGHWADDRRARADHHSVTERRMALVSARTAPDSHAVVDEETTTNGGAGMYLDPREKPHELREHARQQSQP